MWGFIIALVSGALMSIQGVFNTEVTKQTSIWVSSGWVQFSAFIACVIMWFFYRRNEVGGPVQENPKYMLAGGIMGALITYTVIKSVGTLGPAKSALSDCSGSDYCCLCHRSDGAFWRIRSVLNGRRPLALWLPLPGLLFSGGGDREILLFFRLCSGWYLDR